MTRTRARIKNISLVLIFSLVTFTNVAFAQKSPQPKTNVESIDQRIEQLSLEQQVGQLFIFGFSGTKAESALLPLIHKYQPGAIITFARNIQNPQQTGLMNRKAQLLSVKKTGLPLLIMVDQEGGSVSRIKTNPLPPSALSLGMTQNVAVVREVGAVTGRILHTLGFNMNLAPVFDLSDPNEKNFIGNRSFGADPHKVKLMAQAFADGLTDASVLPTAKHFPGHGEITADSHKNTPVKMQTFEELEAHDLVPFRWFIASTMPSAIMVAHISYPKIDPSGMPSAFSKVIIEDVLRKKLNYDGLVITDDIEMLGAGAAGDLGERAIKAIEAGCDMVMVAWSPRRQKIALQAVLKAVRSGRISKERLNQSLRRILMTKARLQINAPKHATSSEELGTELGTHVRDLKKLTRRVSLLNFQRSAADYPWLRKSLPAEREVVVVTADGKFYKNIKSMVKNPVRGVFMARGKSSPIEAEFRKSPDSIGIYYVTGLGTARRLEGLPANIKSRILVVNTTHPGTLHNEKDYMAVFNIYSRNYEVAQWVSEFVFKETIPPPELRRPSSEKEQASQSARPRSRRRFVN